MILPVLLAAALGQAPLTVERAVEIALERSPSLKALALDDDEARAQLDVAAELENPELRIQNLRTDQLLAPAFTEAVYSDHPFEKASIGLRWNPPNPWTRGAIRTKGERRVDETTAEFEDARRSLTARVRTLHATVLGLDLQTALAKSAVERRDELRSLIARRLQQGAATALDQSLADLDYLDALAGLQELESHRRQVFNDLLVQLGADDDDAPSLVEGSVWECVAPAAPETLLSKAEANNPRLRTFDARLAATDAERDKESLAVRPWIENLQLNFVEGGAAPSYGTLRFSVPLPVLDWNGPELRVLDFKRQRIEAERRAEVQSLGRRVRRAIEELTQQVELVRRYREAEPMLEQGLSRLRLALDAAEADLLQIALVQTRMLSARRASLRASLDCRTTRIELDRLVGE